MTRSLFIPDEYEAICGFATTAKFSVVCRLSLVSVLSIRRYKYHKLLSTENGVEKGEGGGGGG